MAEKNATKEIRDAVSALMHTPPKIGRSVKEGFRKCIIDFGSTGYVALYGFDEMREEVMRHAVRHLKENNYK